MVCYVDRLIDKLLKTDADYMNMDIKSVVFHIIHINKYQKPERFR